MNTVYDASALLAVAFAEPGADAVLELLSQPGGEVSAVNWSEVGAKLAERGLKTDDIARELSAFGLDVIPFDEEQANIAASLRPATRPLGLSLGDRSCLALAQVRSARVVTADSNWKKLEGFEVLAVRGV
ncbi:MAG TPA: type II toxin-antitoxin system VapC family toxin [Steroidobacteraceae bacterium]|nr:type II toxin-antitoxin system VapC family toxin [Steroidobacteraceae bacterium]